MLHRGDFSRLLICWGTEYCFGELYPAISIISGTE
jgi:hypothetical protein